ncbi:SusE domain-containing protein [uncultured Chryseobacterium sp.]|uniref:SusE domain-containing protein n=1 Tax=uncultured Chryseobacterium sp. TaxID=259322 RepID=UPI00261992C7|nr:SusE domain-containing protein [uncultured Chryseobacterium sp.]
MKNILKFLFAAILIPFIFGSCANDADRDWTTADPSFKLYNTTLSSNVLYPTMANNPFRLTWDNNAGGGQPYTVQLSSTADFAKPIVLGTATDNTYSSTIGALNTALLQGGYSPYTSQKVYVRVITGTYVSNSISFDVTPYPSAKPVITAPTAGKVIVLNSAAPNDAAQTVTWTDYASYGTDVTYLVEIAPKGTTNFVSAGFVNNLKTLDLTNKALNDAVLKLGAAPKVAADYDIRVTATTKSTGGTINITSDVVTVNITPYVAFKDMYLVGEAVAADWNPDNNNQALFRDPSNTNKFTFVGYFKAGGFKVIEKKGSWQPQWGQDGGVLTFNDGSASDPGTFNIPAAGYYTFEMDIVAKTYSITPYTASATTYDFVGLIGGFTGWSSDFPLEKSTFDAHQWTAKDVSLPAGEVKFRANSDWAVSWGPTKVLQPISGISGQGVQGGENVILESEGIYDIYFNDLDGRYIFVKK